MFLHCFLQTRRESLQKLHSLNRTHERVTLLSRKRVITFHDLAQATLHFPHR